MVKNRFSKDYIQKLAHENLPSASENLKFNHNQRKVVTDGLPSEIDQKLFGVTASNKGSSGMLQSVERYCNNCGDTTKHHVSDMGAVTCGVCWEVAPDRLKGAF